MKKKIRDITLGDMVKVCNSFKNRPCYDCPLCKYMCARTPYELNVTEDLDKEIELPC